MMQWDQNGRHPVLHDATEPEGKEVNCPMMQWNWGQLKTLLSRKKTYAGGNEYAFLFGVCDQLRTRF